MSNEIYEYPVIGGAYKHYKGGHYVVLSMATHTEDQEKLVIYKSVEFGSIYARPLSEWNRAALLDENSEPAERFVFLGEAEAEL